MSDLLSPRGRWPSLLLALLALCCALPALADHIIDPGDRVARLAYADGDVAFSPAGSERWSGVSLNRPLLAGDQLWTEYRSRAELQLGGVALRLDERTAMRLLALSDRYSQVELTEGRLNLFVDRLAPGQTYEIATPTLALSIDRPGSYTVHVDRDGRTTAVEVWDGSATAWGEQSRFELLAGDAVRFYDTDLRDHDFYRLDEDRFQRFCFARDDELEHALSSRYVADDVIGYADLDRYGRWRPVREYGDVWFPQTVSTGWAPYRDGHWIWQAPWGWTWVDDQPWGFAPFHYGRWVSVDGRWGWLPPRTHTAYAPALVAFLGGSHWSVGLSVSSQPVGWFPLGPRDVYVPWYRASRDYFVDVNRFGNDTGHVTRLYDRYYANDQGSLPLDYRYRSEPSAVTIVPGDVLVRSQPVSGARLQVDRQAISRAEVQRLTRLQPTEHSVFGHVTRTPPAPPQQVWQRQVLTQRQPPEWPIANALPGMRAPARDARERLHVLDQRNARVVERRDRGDRRQAEQARGEPGRDRNDRGRGNGAPQASAEPRPSRDASRGDGQRYADERAQHRAERQAQQQVINERIAERQAEANRLEDQRRQAAERQATEQQRRADQVAGQRAAEQRRKAEQMAEQRAAAQRQQAQQVAEQRAAEQRRKAEQMAEQRAAAQRQQAQQVAEQRAAEQRRQAEQMAEQRAAAQRQQAQQIAEQRARETQARQAAAVAQERAEQRGQQAATRAAAAADARAAREGRREERAAERDDRPGRHRGRDADQDDDSDDDEHGRGRGHH